MESVEKALYGERIGSAGPDSVLAGFFRKILFDLKINSNRFQALLDRFILSQGYAGNSIEVSMSRSALRRELSDTTMTWKVFVRGLQSLRVEKAVFGLVLYRDDGEVTGHERVIDIKEEVSDSGEDVGTLAVYFKDILEYLKIFPDDKSETPNEFDKLLNYYVRMSKPGGALADQSQVKCSLKRELLKSRISWKIFVKGIIFLRTYKMIVSVQLIFRNKLVSYHHTTLVFR